MPFETEEKNKFDLDLKTIIKEMDQDVATRFIASAFSLNKNKIKEAYAVACSEMNIREQEKRKKQEVENDNNTLPDTEKMTGEQLKKSTKELIESIQSLFKPQSLDDNETEIEIDTAEIDTDKDKNDK